MGDRMNDIQASPQRVTANSRPRRSSISASPLRQATRSPFSTLKALRRQKSKSATDENNNLVNLFEDITNESELRSPVKIPSPSKGSQTGRKSGGLSLFPSSPIRRNATATPTMLNDDNKRKALTSLPGSRDQEVYKKPNKLPRSSAPATAPAGDRRTKRFDLSDWQLELPAVSQPPMASSPLPSTASFSTFPRSPSTFSTHRPSDFQAGLAAASKDRSFRPSPSPYLEDDDDDEDSPFRVPSVRRSPSDPLASPGAFGSQRGLFASASTAPAASRGKISRDLTIADLTAFNPSASSPSALNSRPSALPQPTWRKQQTVAPEVPASLRKPRSRLFASHPSSSAPSPARSPEEGRRTRPRTNSDATAGALYLESLDEDTINASFASRDPIFANEECGEEEADSPFVAATPRRSRATSVATEDGHGEPISQPQFSYPAVQPRRATSVDNLFGTSASSSSNVFGLLNGRKRNANGAVVMGPRVSQGVRVGSNLAAHSPIAAPSSSPYQARSMFVDMDNASDDDLEEDDCDMGRRSVETSRGSEPGLTDSSSIASSLASSRDSCNSLSSSTSQKFHARRLSEFAASTGSDTSSASIFTPQNYKHVRPLQAAFMSTGLMSKKVRPRDSGVSVDSPAPKPQAPPLPSNIQAPPQPLMNPLLARAKQMPDTPCKRSPAPALLKSQPASSLSVPPVDNDGRLAMTIPTEEGPRAESPPDNSPTSAPSFFSEHKKFGLRKAVPPLFRRRSSGQLAIEAGSTNVHASGGSSSSGASYDYEPMTPTRGAHEGFQLDGPQLVTTPVAPSPPKALPVAPVLSITTPTTQTFPTALNTCPRPPAHFYPPTAGRPQFRHRHSGSVLHSIRQQQLALPDRFETNFSITRSIGRGVSSEAFAVVNRETGAVSAVKRTKTPSTGPKDRLRRLEEIDILRQISTHKDKSPYIVSLFSAWEQEGHLYIETELCGRGNLAEFLDAHGQVHEFLDEARVWKITTQIALGIQHLHDRNILHLDLKPANIFVSEDGNLKLGDFGLATRWPRTSAVAILKGAAMDEADNLDGKAVPGIWPTTVPSTSDSMDLEREGDREYIAPEVLSGRYGKEADIFSFGLVILEAAANVVLPDNGLSWHRLRSNDFSEVSTSRLSTPLSSLLVGLLAQDPQSRSNISKVSEHPIIAYLADEFAHRRLLSEGADVMMEDSLTDPVTGAIEPQADADDFLAQLLGYYEGCRRTNDYMALD